MKRVKYPTLVDQGEYRLPPPAAPFESINLELNEKNQIKVNAQIVVKQLMGQDGMVLEGARFGIALDGSASMTNLYGTSIGRYGYGTLNEVEPVAKAMIKFLSEFDKEGEVDLIYWSVGRKGNEIEDRQRIGPRVRISKPKKRLGRRTILLPALEHFYEKFSDSPWSMGVIITDGHIDDMDNVEKFTEDLARKMKNSEVEFMKFVLIGVGEYVSYTQIEHLDNFVTSVGIDIWDSTFTAEWTSADYDIEDDSEEEKKGVMSVFKEVMSDNLMIANGGKVLDDKKREVFSRSDGFPAKLEFILESDAKGFFLEIQDHPPIAFDLSKGIEMLLNNS